MEMNPTLLRTVLDEWSADPPPTITDHHGRTAGIRRKLVARRRRRIVTGAGAAALIAAVLGAAVPQVWGGADPAPDGHRVEAAAPFPEYLDGYRVVATASAPLADRSITLTFVPTTPDFVLYTRCDGHGVDGNFGIAAELFVGNQGVEGVACYFTPRGGDAAELVPWEPFGPNVGVYEGGEPVTLTINLTTVAAYVGGDVNRLPPFPSQGTVAVAVAEPVPFEDYPLPAPPAELAPLPESPSGSFEVRADAADPNRRIETIMEWDAALAGCGDGEAANAMNLVSQTPGSLRVLIDDVEVAEHTWWDYEQEGSPARLDLLMCAVLSEGEEVTVVVEPEHMTGDWQVVIGAAGE
jgi:hypothetical protein